MFSLKIDENNKDILYVEIKNNDKLAKFLLSLDLQNLFEISKSLKLTLLSLEIAMEKMKFVDFDVMALISKEKINNYYLKETFEFRKHNMEYLNENFNCVNDYIDHLLEADKNKDDEILKLKEENEKLLASTRSIEIEMYKLKEELKENNKQFNKVKSELDEKLIEEKCLIDKLGLMSELIDSINDNINVKEKKLIDCEEKLNKQSIYFKSVEVDLENSKKIIDDYKVKEEEWLRQEIFFEENFEKIRVENYKKLKNEFDGEILKRNQEISKLNREKNSLESKMVDLILSQANKENDEETVTKKDYEKLAYHYEELKSKYRMKRQQNEVLNSQKMELERKYEALNEKFQLDL